MESFRFKVVKIISKEPFKRGRWLCMDFTDPPSNGTTNIEDCLANNHPDITSSTGQGISAVAIDNKIEQAMDLVKSHLMFAVREEMDVLKEKICELTEKNNRLEMENKIYRAHATSETVQLVDQFNQQQAQIQPRLNSPSQQTQQIVSLPNLPFQQSQQNTNSSQQQSTPQQQIIQHQITTSAISTISTPPQITQQFSQQQINNQQQINQTQVSQINQQITQPDSA